MSQVIAIPTHISGIEFLENMLNSMNGYNKYDIYIVINDYKKQDEPIFSSVINKFRKLPISIIRMRGNHGEYGAIYSIFNETDYQEMFILSHSCEIKDLELFEIIFEKFHGRSVALSYSPQLLPHMHSWSSFLGKYRRNILKKIDLKYYLPSNFMESCIAEFYFTNLYSKSDNATVCLFPDFVDSEEFVEKFGKKRMVIKNEYLIKWKSHWNKNMVLDKIKSMGKTPPSQEEINNYFKKYSTGGTE